MSPSIATGLFLSLFPHIYSQLAGLFLILRRVSDRNPNYGQCGSFGDPNSRPLRWFRRHFSPSQPLEASGWPTSQWVDSVSAVSGSARPFHTLSWISLSPVSFSFDLFFVMFTFSGSCYFFSCFRVSFFQDKFVSVFNFGTVGKISSRACWNMNKFTNIFHKLWNFSILIP